MGIDFASRRKSCASEARGEGGIKVALRESRASLKKGRNEVKVALRGKSRAPEAGERESGVKVVSRKALDIP